MKYSRILPKRIVGQVIAASPDANFVLADLARDVVAVLRSEAENPLNCRIFNTGGDTSYSMVVGKVAEQIQDGPTAHSVGHVLHDLGFESSHTRVGNIIYWNEAQLDILDAALAGAK